MPTQATTAAFNTIMQSSLFRLNGPDIDLCEALGALCDAINSEPEDSDWVYLGEFLECDCASLIVGAYWALAEWHAGQWSPEYAAMSQIGAIFSPGMTSGPEPYSGESCAYDAVNEYFAARPA